LGDTEKGPRKKKGKNLCPSEAGRGQKKTSWREGVNASKNERQISVFSNKKRERKKKD